MENQALAHRKIPFVELDGAFYQTLLEQLHSMLRPQTYFEIGTLNGDTRSIEERQVDFLPKNAFWIIACEEIVTCHLKEITDGLLADTFDDNSYSSSMDIEAHEASFSLADKRGAGRDRPVASAQRRAYRVRRLIGGSKRSSI
jgi:hypothetical protein